MRTLALVFLLASCGSGETGPDGAEGPAGAMGSLGASGPMGPGGAMGDPGSSGGSGMAGPSGPMGAAGSTAGAQGASGPRGPGLALVSTVLVNPVGTDTDNGTALLSALAATSGPALIKIQPGIYDLGTGSLTMKDDVDIEGSGILTTIIKSSLDGGPTVKMAQQAQLRDLQVQSNRPGTGSSLAIELAQSGRPTQLLRVRAVAGGGSSSNWAVHCAPCAGVLENVEIQAQNFSAMGVYVEPANLGSFEIVGSQIASDSYGVYVRNQAPGATDLRILHSHIIAGATPLQNDRSGFNVRVLDTWLDNASGNTRGGVGGYQCVGDYNNVFTALDNTCI